MTTIDIVRDSEGWLTEETYQAIEATLPKCPECGEEMAYIHMVEHQLHRVVYSIDDHAGEVLIDVEKYDSTFTEAERDFAQGKPVSYIVECDNGHQWPEKRLKWEYISTRSSTKRWELLP